MKQIFIIFYVLIGMLACGQEAKLDYYYIVDPSDGDTVWFHDYIYDDDNYLKKIYEGIPGDTIWEYNYSHDTLVSIYWQEGGITHYLDYYADSVVRWHVNQGDTTNEIYYLNDLGQVTDFVTDNQTISSVWDEDNVAQKYVDNELVTFYNYSTEYINPFFEENKYLRANNLASINNMTLEYHLGGGIYEYEVVESIGPYPLLIERFKNGVLHTERHFKYVYVITDTPEFDTEPGNTLSINYFDLMGREINKPKRGFYIKCEFKDKGVISTKHYIP